MIVVAILGLLAAIAIPAFVKYIRRAKTTEAMMNLRKLFDSSVTYYEKGHTTRLGQPLIPRFPGVEMDFGAVPGTNECCGLVGDKCPPPGSPQAPGYFQERWDHPVWHALNFGVDDPHYYWYEYDAVGVGADALNGGSAFTARASADLNCNLVFSTFERVGGVDPENNVVGGAGIFKLNPLE